MLMAAVCAGGALSARPPEDQRPVFTAAGELQRPADYREWVYLTTGLGMSYGAAKPEPDAAPLFDNVFVNREAHREFLRSGTWPEQTIFVLELRRSEEKVSINSGGRTQGEVVAIEVAVKDRKRFPEEGWAYFDFGDKGASERARPFPRSAGCYSCHRDHGAVDNTFVQFYPTLFEAAKRHGTLKPGYDPARVPRAASIVR
jgi:hypothetical protein